MRLEIASATAGDMAILSDCPGEMGGVTPDGGCKSFLSRTYASQSSSRSGALLGLLIPAPAADLFEKVVSSMDCTRDRASVSFGGRRCDGAISPPRSWLSVRLEVSDG